MTKGNKMSHTNQQVVARLERAIEELNEDRRRRLIEDIVTAEHDDHLNPKFDGEPSDDPREVRPDEDCRECQRMGFFDEEDIILDEFADEVE
tara:strand:+ start:42 stop:317 length:276 start_codon:yes stop_codon:yes gene_type:complete